MAATKAAIKTPGAIIMPETLLNGAVSQRPIQTRPTETPPAGDLSTGEGEDILRSERSKQRARPSKKAFSGFGPSPRGKVMSTERLRMRSYCCAALSLPPLG